MNENNIRPVGNYEDINTIGPKAKKDGPLLRLIKKIGSAVAKFFSAIGRFFKRLFGFKERKEQLERNEIQDTLNKFPTTSRKLDDVDIDSQVNMENPSSNRPKISEKEDPELTELVREGDRVIKDIVEIGVDKHINKLEVVQEVNKILPEVGKVFPVIKKFLTDSSLFINGVMNNKENIKEAIPSIVREISDVFLTNFALLLKGSSVISDHEKLSPYTEAFNKIIATFSAHLKQQFVYHQKMKVWDANFARAQDESHTDQTSEDIREKIKTLGRDKAYLTYAMIKYQETCQESKDNKIYTDKYINQMINKDVEIQLKGICKKMAEQLLPIVYPETSDDKYSFEQFIPENLHQLTSEGVALAQQIDNLFDSDGREYAKSLSKNLLVSGIAYGLEKLFNTISDPKNLKPLIYELTLPKIEEQIKLSFVRQILLEQVEEFEPFFTTKKYHQKDEDVCKKISAKLREALIKSITLYKLDQSEEDFRTMIQPLFDEINEHFKGEKIESKESFKEGIIKLFEPENGVKDNNFAEIAYDAAFKIGGLEVEGLTNVMMGTFGGTIKSKLSSLISDQAEPYRKSYKKAASMIADAIKVNLKSKEEIEETIFVENQEDGENIANEKINNKIVAISKIIHDLITSNLPTGWIKGRLAKKAVTQSVGDDEKKLVQVFKNVFSRVLGVTTEEKQVAIGNKLTNQNLILHLFDTAIVALEKASNNVQLIANVEHLVA